MGIVSYTELDKDIYKIGINCKPTPELITCIIEECNIPFKMLLISTYLPNEIRVINCSFNGIIDHDNDLYVYKDGNICRPLVIDGLNRKSEMIQLSFEDITKYGLKKLIIQYIKQYEINNNIIVAFHRVLPDLNCVQFRIFNAHLYNTLLDFTIDSNYRIINEQLYKWYTDNDSNIVKLHNMAISCIESLDKSVFLHENLNNVLKYFKLEHLFKMFYQYHGFDVSYENDILVGKIFKYTDNLENYIKQFKVFKCLMENYSCYEQLCEIGQIG